jgi:hypothetical protein
VKEGKGIFGFANVQALKVKGFGTSFSAEIEDRVKNKPDVIIRQGEAAVRFHVLDAYCGYWRLLPKEIPGEHGEVDVGALRKTLEGKGLEVQGIKLYKPSQTLSIVAIFQELPKATTGRLALRTIYFLKKESGQYELNQLAPTGEKAIGLTKNLYNLFTRNRLRVLFRLRLRLPIKMARVTRGYRKERKAVEKANKPKPSTPRRMK